MFSDRWLGLENRFRVDRDETHGAAPRCYLREALDVEKVGAANSVILSLRRLRVMLTNQ